MTLTFRGLTYQTSSTEVASIPTTETGKYRGVALKFSAPQSVHRANIQLTYRGITYIH